LANKHYHEARRHWQGLAENARKCGQALIQARYFGLWKRGDWKKWLRDNFDGSYETAKVYIRIAKKWDDPRLQEARRQGVTLDSISSILEVLSGKRRPDGSLDVEPGGLDSLLSDIMKMFADAVGRLCKEELTALREAFDEYWELLYRRLYHDVCMTLDFGLNEYLLELHDSRKKYHTQKSKRKKSLRDFVREGERAAREDMKIPNIRSRREWVEREKEPKQRASDIIRQARNRKPRRTA
jgi:hypothetical protein